MAHMSRNQKYTDATGAQFERADESRVPERWKTSAAKMLQARAESTYGASYGASVYEPHPCGIMTCAKLFLDFRI